MKNNVNIKTILVYENLPSGGAKTLFISNIQALRDRFKLKIILSNEKLVKLHNIFSYLYYIYFRDNEQWQTYNEHLLRSHILIAYHTWITRSPMILRQNLIPAIYVCQEAPREFYDEKYISMFTLKEKIINMLRIKIKNIDKLNVSSNKNLTIIANSNFSSKNINKVYGNKAKVVYPGIKLSKFGKYCSIENRLKQILCVGAINKLKNQKFILELISTIREKERPKVLFVGNGGNRRYVKEMYQYAKRFNIDLIIKQNINNKELIQEYKKSRIFCYAPTNEPFGIVILEAMRSGLPIVASSIGGGYNEIVSSSNGFIISPKNKLQWLRAIKKLLNDDTLWKKYSKFNYHYVAKFSEAVMNKKFINIVDQLLTTS